jgi:hypothetical protein
MCLLAAFCWSKLWTCEETVKKVRNSEDEADS